MQWSSGKRYKNHIDPLILENEECTRNDKEVEEEVILAFPNLFSLVVQEKPFVHVLIGVPF